MTKTQIEIIYQDKSIVVCVKPIGVLSQQSDKGEENMISLLKEQCECEIYPVHRLDRQVGGVMVFAKTKSAAASLSKQITDKVFTKKYLAVVHGTFEEKSGIMEDLLFKDSAKNKVFVVKRERRGVKKAKLEYGVLQEKDGFSVVSVFLHTGRTHQIRVQFASRKHPLKGDSKYGARDAEKRIFLWSKEIGFIHPETNKEVLFSAECDFSNL